MLDIRATTPDDLPELVALETASYPGDEAATPEGLRARYAQAAPYFLTARLEGRIVGFICATRIDLAYLSEESMSTHTPTGPSLCIHSVVVEQSHRRRGYATELLRAFITLAANDANPAKDLLLITKEYALPLYTSVGFVCEGPWRFQHGAEQWLHCRRSNHDNKK